MKCSLSTNQMVTKVGKVMKKEFEDKVWNQKCGKVDFFFRKLWFAQDLDLGLAFQGVKTSTFDWTRWCPRLGK